MVICPFISSGSAIMPCTNNCALLCNGRCALAVLAEAKLKEQEKKQ